jgi:hypothetical protein
MRLLGVVSGYLSLVLIAGGLWVSGQATPHIRWEINDFFLHAEVDQNGVLSSTLYIELENEGSTSFTLTGISAEMPGLRLLPADETKDETIDETKEERSVLTVKEGDMGTMKRRLVITDCAAVPHEPQPVRFTYRTWMGSGAAEVTWDSWPQKGDRGGILLAWQRGLAGKVCEEAMSSKWS